MQYKRPVLITARVIGYIADAFVLGACALPCNWKTLEIFALVGLCVQDEIAAHHSLLAPMS
jgi:hypothetical protein